MSKNSLVFLADLPSNQAEKVVGNVADLAEGQILLPSFVEERPDGLWISPEKADAATIAQLVNRVFATGACFVDVDYAGLCALLYPKTPSDAPLPTETRPPFRLAREIRPIAAERQALYKSIKLADGGACAEYVFEPVFIERVTETPIYGEQNEAGEFPITGVERSTYAEPATLDVDEFIAMMWQKGVRAGLDLTAIRNAIAASGVQRIEIAHRVEPKEGSDATLTEETQALHRDDSPRLLPNGRIDLRHFKNRFPQIGAGTRLLRKVPRRFGECGVEIGGRNIEPPPPRDFSLTDMAGPGTVIETNNQGEFIVAVCDGFLNLDAASHLVSITDKIINRESISVRTTGNLSLAGEEFEQHGEVQERRVVEGKHMTFHADVFGRIESSGGQVILKANLAGGGIHDTGGQVSVEGRASQAVIEARDGSVQVGYAENCLIIAAQVTIKRALACTIVGDDVTIEDACACAIAGRRVTLARSGARKDTETLVSVIVPDLSALEKSLDEERKAIADLEARQVVKRSEIALAESNPELKGFLAVEIGVRSGKLKLNQAQQDQLRLLTQRLAKPIQHLRALRSEAETLKTEIATEQEEIVSLEKRRQEAGENISCKIGEIYGATAVRKMAVAPGAPLFAGAAPNEVKLILREPKGPTTTLMRAETGEFAWSFGAS